jgi:hypothetical protein
VSTQNGKPCYVTIGPLTRSFDAVRVEGLPPCQWALLFCFVISDGASERPPAPHRETKMSALSRIGKHPMTRSWKTRITKGANTVPKTAFLAIWRKTENTESSTWLVQVWGNATSAKVSKMVENDDFGKPKKAQKCEKRSAHFFDFFKPLNSTLDPKNPQLQISAHSPKIKSGFWGQKRCHENKKKLRFLSKNREIALFGLFCQKKLGFTKNGGFRIPQEK